MHRIVLFIPWVLVMVLNSEVFGQARAPHPTLSSPIRIKKVLSQLVDTQGRNSLAPSLFERDAYQAMLRSTPEKRGGLRFDVLQAGLGGKESVTIRVELRGSQGKRPTEAVMEKVLEGRELGRRWHSLTLEGAAYQKFGDLVAWRASFWRAGQKISEQKSFLW